MEHNDRLTELEKMVGLLGDMVESLGITVDKQMKMIEDLGTKAVLSVPRPKTEMTTDEREENKKRRDRHDQRFDDCFRSKED